MRFSFTQIPQEKLVVCEDVVQACDLLRGDGNEQLYAVTCFSDKEKFMSQTTVK